MSYILDALKRADTARTRGAVPGLHAHQLPGSGNVAPPPLQSRIWLLIVAVATLAAVAVGLWVWRTPLATAPMPATPAPLAQAANPKADVNAASASPTGATPARNAGTPAATTSVTPATKPAKTTNATTASTSTAAAPANTASPASAPALKAAQASAPPAVASAATPAAIPATTPLTPPAAAPVNIPLLSELPDTLRRQLPALSITGTVYAEDPKQRLLLVNNQVLPQGSVMAPDLTLEEIRPRSSVFNFRGTRFRVAH